MVKALNSVILMKNVIKKFNKELEGKIDSLGIDTEKSTQTYYVNIGEAKYYLSIRKLFGEYKWRVIIQDNSAIYYETYMSIDVHTGKAKVTIPHVNNLHTLAV